MTKTCSGCREEKPAEDFAKRARSPDGLQAYCRTCSLEKNREWRAKNPDRARATARERYQRDPEKGRRRTEQWREKHADRLAVEEPVKRRRATLAQYGLTPSSYRRMLESQDGRCAICDSDDPVHWSGRFQVDHCHDTGAVRGLLCSRCNGGLGMFDDSPKRLSAAMDYLKESLSKEEIA